MIGIIISTATVIVLPSCKDVSECKTTKSPYDCEEYCKGNWKTQGAIYDEETKECCCY